MTSSIDYANRTVLVTGGTGSFGRTAARMLLASGCGEVRVLSRDELKQELMRQEFADPRLRFYLGDVRDRDSVDAAMRGVDWVFHAAALKQVPSCEFFPMQAVLTNIVGSHNVIEVARSHEVERVVCLSTDKAAYPINAMGMTKALAEKVAQASARLRTEGDTVVAAVRYGNVLCSRGSVVPLFLKQIRAGGPITITERAMTRFLMSLPEALDLVLYALGHARAGDLFIKKAPACTIGELSKALQHLLGAEVGEEVIGIRHGEKLFETLATRDELTRAEDHGDYYRIVMDDRDLNYGKYFSQGTRTSDVIDDYTSHNTTRLAAAEIQHVLAGLPEVQTQLALPTGQVA